MSVNEDFSMDKDKIVLRTDDPTYSYHIEMEQDYGTTLREDVKPPFAVMYVITRTKKEKT